jgi:hypothetical protein
MSRISNDAMILFTKFLGLDLMGSAIVRLTRKNDVVSVGGPACLLLLLDDGG